MNGDETLEAERTITSQKTIYQPSKQEWDDLQHTHIPFRKRRACCGKGKCLAVPHKHKLKSDSDVENQIIVISFDYRGQRSKELSLRR